MADAPTAADPAGLAAAGGAPAPAGGHRGSGRLGRGAVLALGQGVHRGAVAVYFLALIGVLSKGGFGDLAYVVAVVSIAAALADGGFARLLLRDVTHAGADAGSLIGELLVIRCLAIAAVAVITAVAAGLGLLPGGTALLLVAVAYLVLEAGALGFEAAGAGAERPWRVAAPQFAGALALAVALVLVLVGEPTTTVALGGLAASAGTRLVVSAALWGRALAFRPGVIDRARVAERFRQALPFLVLALLAALYFRLDVIILHGRRGAVETASYAAAYRIVDAVVVLGAVVFATLAPGLSRLQVERPEAVRAEWRRLLRLMVLVAAPPLLVLGLLAEPICELLFGRRYGDSAARDLRLLLPGTLLMLLQIINAAVVLMGTRQGAVVKLTLLNLAVNAVAAWFLIGAYGSSGAAVATSLAELFTFLGFAALVASRHGRRGQPEPERTEALGGPIRASGT